MCKHRLINKSFSPLGAPVWGCGRGQDPWRLSGPACWLRNWNLWKCLPKGTRWLTKVAGEWGPVVHTTTPHQPLLPYIWTGEEEGCGESRIYKRRHENEWKVSHYSWACIFPIRKSVGQVLAENIPQGEECAILPSDVRRSVFYRHAQVSANLFKMLNYWLSELCWNGKRQIALVGNENPYKEKIMELS